MADPAKFGLLRKVLRAVGLSEVAVNDLIDWITDRLADDQLDKEIDAYAQEERIDSATAPVIFPYRIRDDFMSPAERSFFHVLKGVAGTRFLIARKVGLADLFYVKSGDAREHRVFTNKIDRKHVDFVLCDPQTLTPLAGIELDDKSHEREDRKQRDDFVEGVFSAAGLKLLRVPVQRGYQPQELAAMLETVLPSVSGQPVLASDQFAITGQATPIESLPTNGHQCREAVSVIMSSPPCPKCGSEMVLGTAKQGNNEGEQFWGCSNFPRCRTMVPYERVTA